MQVRRCSGLGTMRLGVPTLFALASFAVEEKSLGIGSEEGSGLPFLLLKSMSFLTLVLNINSFRVVNTHIGSWFFRVFISNS